MQHQFTENDIIEHLRGLQESARVIDLAIAENVRAGNIPGDVGRHVMNIEIMCKKPHLSGRDLEAFVAAAARGTAWLAQQ